MNWDHLSDTRPVARKPHQCYLCCKQIDRGQRYVRRTGVSEGKIGRFAMHELCEKVASQWDEWQWECFDPGDSDFLEELEEYASQVTPPSMSLVGECLKDRQPKEQA